MSFFNSNSKSKRACEPTQGRGSPLPMNTRNDRGVAGALPDFRVEIRCLMEGEWTDGTGKGTMQRTFASGAGGRSAPVSSAVPKHHLDLARSGVCLDARPDRRVTTPPRRDITNAPRRRTELADSRDAESRRSAHVIGHVRRAAARLC
ncbi:hypothetical protein EVAR_19908_1 [Eumeta japonica]|uniref:Uncharacterized protein n=1 Tax=Eumeta variegata TaxID=151549 RepID=A0A4C1ZM88_EUMVA|nr:hypothetical protein EVAR_19908_1 [Eumeta japonica]